MHIIFVSSDVAWLNAQATLLRQSAPPVSVMTTIDPLTAAQYGQANPVDILVAPLNMRRMNGLQLSAFLHAANPQLQAWLMGTAQEFDDCLESCDGFRHPLLLPASTEALLRILHSAAS